MNKSQPPFRAQLLLALLTQPWQLAPSLVGKCVSGTSNSSAARDGVYKRPMLARHVESAFVDTSGNALPAFCQLFPLRTYLLAYPCDLRIMYGVLCDHVEDTCVLV